MKSLSELIESIKMDLGIYGLSLPIDNLDEQLYNVFKLRTIKTFSQYHPYVEQIELDLNELETNTNNFNKREYIIPNIFGDRRIISVRDVSQRPIGIGYGQPSSMGCSMTSENMMLGTINADINSMMSPPQTFEFIQPNRLVLYNMYMYATRVTIELTTEHFSNLASIPASQWETFENLALLDTKRFLYGILKHYNEIQTAHGNINLRIDDWANAEQDRRELLKEWDGKYHLDSTPVYFI